MGLKYRKSIKICKGVRVNFGKTGASLSFGTKGLRKTIHSSGRVTTSIGIPGTGLYYTNSSGGKRTNTGRSSSTSARARIQAQKQQQKMTELEENKQAVQRYNMLIENIKSLHKTCDDYVDWQRINQVPAPFDPLQQGPAEISAMRDYDNFKPNFFEKIFTSKAEKHRSEMLNQVAVAKEEDNENYAEWESLKKLSTNILRGNIDDYFQVIDEMKPFDDLLEFGSNFEVGTDKPDLLEIEFHVKSDNVVPNQVISLTKSGKISTKEMTKTQHYDLIQDYVCSCTIRIVRDIFALLPVQIVIVHAIDTSLNTATGFSEDITILSVAIDRNKLNALNFQMIDPSDAIETFGCHMNFKKTQGLKPVDRVQL